MKCFKKKYSKLKTFQKEIFVMEQQGVLQRHVSETCYVRVCCTVIKSNEKTCARVLNIYV